MKRTIAILSIVVLCFGTDDDLRCSGSQVFFRVFPFPEESRALQDDIDVMPAPWQVGGVFFMRYRDSPGSDLEIIRFCLDLKGGPSMNGIVFDQIGEIFDWGRAVGRDKDDILRRV